MPARKPKIEVSCAYCSATFTVLPSRVGRQLYCSIACGKLGGKQKQSAWGLTNRADPAYKQTQSERTTKSWENEASRANHLSAMEMPEYKTMRSENAYRIMESNVWKEAITTYKDSGEAKRRCATRRMPKLPEWRRYTALNGKEYRFRSAWEEALARYLDSSYLHWEFEPRKFILDDGSSYTPDFYVESPFGSCYVECHRLTKIKPGDEEKVAKLFRIAKENLLGAPLILLDKPEITQLFRLVGMKYKKRI